MASETGTYRRPGGMLALRPVLREPLFVSLLLSLLIFTPMFSVPKYSYASLDNSSFAASVDSISNRIVMYSTVSVSIPLFIDLILDLLNFRSSEISNLGYRFLSLFSILIVNAFGIAFQHVYNAATLAITMFLWGFYLEFCVVTSFLHYLIPDYFSLSRVLVLNTLLFVMAVVPGITLMPFSPQFTLKVVFFVAFYLYVALSIAFSLSWLAQLRKQFLQSKASFFLWLRGLDNNYICVLILLSGLALTLVMFVIIFHVLVPNMPNVADVVQPVHQLVDITRSCLCIFTYVIPYRMFREKLIAARRDLEIKTEFVKYISHEMRTPVGSILVGNADDFSHLNMKCRRYGSS